MGMMQIYNPKIFNAGRYMQVNLKTCNERQVMRAEMSSVLVKRAPIHPKKSRLKTVYRLLRDFLLITNE